jgi:hypothetical protein
VHRRARAEPFGLLGVPVGEPRRHGEAPPRRRPLRRRVPLLQGLRDRAPSRLGRDAGLRQVLPLLEPLDRRFGLLAELAVDGERLLAQPDELALELLDLGAQVAPAEAGRDRPGDADERLALLARADLDEDALAGAVSARVPLDRPARAVGQWLEDDGDVVGRHVDGRKAVEGELDADDVAAPRAADDPAVLARRSGRSRDAR